MAPVRIRYHVPETPEVNVIRYNDPLKGGHRNRPHQHRSRHHNKHRLRESKSDFDYDYRPRQDDFDHMRRSVPEKYWGPYNPHVYKNMRDWDGQEDDRYYDFKYGSYRKYASEGDYRPEYDPDPRREDRPYNGRYEANTLPPPNPRPPHGFESHRRVAPSEYDRGYHTHRPTYDPDYERGYRYERRPVGGSYDRGYDHYHRGPGRDEYNYRRPNFVQSEIIVPRDRFRPLPYLGDPNRKPHEHRRQPKDPLTYRSYHYDPHRYHPEEPREFAHYHSPRSEEPVGYPSPYPYRDDRTMEPPPPIMNKGHRIHRHYGYCDASPEKSSKYIPAMNYDELRCPNCQDKVQAFQNDVLAYPWTVQTFRPKKPISYAQASVITPSVFTDTVRNHPDTINAVVSRNRRPPMTTVLDNKVLDNKTILSNKATVKAVKEDNPKPAGTGNKEKPGKENKDTKDEKKKPAAEDKKTSDPKTKDKEKKPGKTPLSDTGNVPPSKPLLKTDDDVTKGSKVRNLSNKPNRKKPGLETVRESPDENDDTIINADFDDFDEIRPQDSISNVRGPVLRAYPTGPNNTEHKMPSLPRARTETEVTPYSYPSGRYFPRLEYVPPKPAQATPLPGRHHFRDPSRRMQGRYYERQSGRLYDYDVNYTGRRIHGDRRPLILR